MCIHLYSSLSNVDDIKTCMSTYYSVQMSTQLGIITTSLFSY